MGLYGPPSIPSRKKAGIPLSAASEIQVLGYQGTVSGGTFAATGTKPDGSSGQATGIAWNASVLTIVNALIAAGVTNINWIGTAGGGSALTLPNALSFIYGGAQANSPQPLMTVDGTGLTGGGTASVTRLVAGYAGDSVGALPGDLAMDTTTGFVYVNVGTASAPIWMLTNPNQQVPYHGVARVVALGDSITGGGVVNQPLIHSTGANSWHAIAAMLSNGVWTLVNNGGQSGQSSSTILASMPNTVYPYNPTHCVIMAGINDTFDLGVGGGSDITTLYGAGNTIANLTQIVANCRNRGIVPILCTLCANSATGAGAKQQFVSLVNDWIRDFCWLNDVILFDAHTLTVDATTGKYKANFSIDGTHPSAGVGVRTLASSLNTLMTALVKTNAVVPLVDTVISLSNTRDRNLLNNGLFRTPTANLASGWTNTSGADVTLTNNASDASFCVGNSQMVTGTGTAATATPTISSGIITGISGLSGGALYLTAPTVQFYDPTGAGSGASATATISGGAVTGITGLVGGTNYSGSTVVQFNGGFGNDGIRQVISLPPDKVLAGDLIGFGGRVAGSIELGQADPNLLAGQYLIQLSWLDVNGAVIDGFYPLYGMGSDIAAGTFWQTGIVPSGAVQVQIDAFVKLMNPGCTLKVGQFTLLDLTRLRTGYVFQPSDLSGLSRWYRADAGVKVATGASNWIDLSATNGSVVQATGGSQPVVVPNSLNGKTVLRFNASTSKLTDSVANRAVATSGMHIFVVARKAAANFGQMVGQDAANSVGADCFYFGDDAANNLRFQMVAGSSVALIASHASAQNVGALYEANYDGAHLNGFFNGAAIGSPAAVTGSMPSSPTTTLAIGAQHAGGGPSWNGDIAEVIIFNRALSSAEQTLVRNYLNGRYAIY